LFPASVPGQAFTEARTRGDVLLSDETVAELVNVLRRPKFDRYVLPEERDRFIAALIRQATLVTPTERTAVCRDPKDNKWVELAIAGNSSWIVTGDDDLLALDGFRGITIVAPAVFLRLLTE
jgi:putative PIN family toxin of toxin-antitoxin system